LLSLVNLFAWGWRSIFYIGGVAPILLAIALYSRMKRSGLEKRASGATSGQSGSVKSVVTVLFRERRALTTAELWGGFFFTQLILLLMLNWLPSLMVGLGFTRAQSSWAAVLFNAAGAVGAAYLGRQQSGTRRRLWVIVTYVGIALSLVALPLAGASFARAAVAVSAAGFFIIAAQLILFALAPMYYARPIRGTGVGSTVAVGRLGSVFGPLYAGALITGGASSAVVLLGILPFVLVGGGAALALTWRPQAID
jgi:AAHS family 3-hydroxyphenylpropionic acid transporter